MQQRFRRQLLALKRADPGEIELDARFQQFMTAVRAEPIGERPSAVEVMDVLLAINVRRETATALSDTYYQAAWATATPQDR